MPNSIIKFEAIDTGKRNQAGEIIYEHNFEIAGEEVDIFCLLCDAIHQNKQFEKLVKHALKFNREHDFSNCPHCRAQS